MNGLPVVYMINGKSRRGIIRDKYEHPSIIDLDGKGNYAAAPQSYYLIEAFKIETDNKGNDVDTDVSSLLFDHVPCSDIVGRI